MNAYEAPRLNAYCFFLMPFAKWRGPDRMITPDEIRTVIMQGELIEDYPDDTRGHSCLLHGQGVDQRDIHVVCAPKENFLAVITAYIPTDDEWEQDLRTRRLK